MGKVIKKPVESSHGASGHEPSSSSKVDSLPKGILGGTLSAFLPLLLSNKGSGGSAIAKGIFTGVTGVVSQPLEGVQKHGVKGLVTGFGKV